MNLSLRPVAARIPKRPRRRAADAPPEVPVASERPRFERFRVLWCPMVFDTFATSSVPGSLEPSVKCRFGIRDVVVIGAGPAGATAAANLADAGASVTLIERTRFPRFHIGESLLPASSPVLERLGVLSQLRSECAMVKRGATFRHESGRYDCSIEFGDSLEDVSAETLQVRRSRFDELLLQAAIDRGVRVLQPARVSDLSFDPEGVDVSVESEIGTSTERARYVIDASGQSGFLSKQLVLRSVEPALRNVAVHGHFTGVRWSPRVPRGDIQVISRSDLGWIWLIPLSDELVSVGLVLSKELALRGNRSQLRQLFLDALRESGAVREQLQMAELEGPVRRDADYSYQVRQYTGDRWLLAGDAGSFLDPVFSTGVTIALQSGEEAAEAVAGCLRTRGRSGRYMRSFERQQRSRYRFFSRFVKGFYRPGFRDLLCQKNEALQIPSALTAVLAGQWNPRWSVRWRLEAFYLLAHLQKSGRLVESLHDSPGRSHFRAKRLPHAGSLQSVDQRAEGVDSETATV